MPLPAAIEGYRASLSDLAQRQQGDIQTIHAVGLLQKMQQEQQLREALAKGDMGTLAKLPGGLDLIGKMAVIQTHQAQAGQLAREQAVFSPENIARNTTGGTPARPASLAELLPPDVAGPPAPAIEAQPSVPGQINLDALRKQAATTGVKGMELYGSHLAQEQARKDKLQQDAELAKQRSEDMRLSQVERNQARMDMIRLAASLRQPPQPSPPVAITGPDGKPVLVSREQALGQAPAVKETAERVIPASIVKAYTENSTALRKIDKALAEVALKPNSFGLQNMRGDAISQRLDPEGVTARAIVSDIGSLKIHDRSGAAVTASETPRLLPFIPTVNDNAATITKKLNLFKNEYAAIQNDIGSIYGEDQGYKALPGPKSRASDAPGAVIDFNSLPK